MKILFGRAEMCMQFAELLTCSLAHLHFRARICHWHVYLLCPMATRFFRWQHAWVRVEQEVIDGNIDSLFENPMVPAVVKVFAVLGSRLRHSPDRRLAKITVHNFRQTPTCLKCGGPNYVLGLTKTLHVV